MFRKRDVPTRPVISAREEDLASGSLPARSPREWLPRTLSGRLLIVAVVVKLLAWAVQIFWPLPGPVRALSSLATLVLLAAAAYLAWRGVVLVKQRLLWRVRRKLILSYVFIGVVPTLLIVAFFLFGGLLVFMNISAYLFKDEYDEKVKEMQTLARGIELELGAASASPRAIIERRVEREHLQYPDLSIALVPVGSSLAARAAGLTAGTWRHFDPPTAVPGWVREDGFAGTLAYAPAGAPQEQQLLVRAVALPETGAGWAVVVDLPVDGQLLEHLRDTSGVRAGALTVATSADGVGPQVGRPRGSSVRSPAASPVEVSMLNASRTVAVLDWVDWATGRSSVAYLSLSVQPRDLYDRISGAQGLLGGRTLGQIFLVTLVFVAVLFLIIEFVALVMGFALARSITSSVHELFMGTERVRQGDFTHRITVKSQDQLGELADSFNQMTGSIEDLMQQAAEKKRLEEELRIAREIQMSLLPAGPLMMPGLAVTALCVPAREVGGDYYDFFPLGPRRVGVLIADVAGKGTFAALYMAELKGLLLSLSEIHQSPRTLLIEVNRILAENIASRSFITMTYLVVDLETRLMTYARAGHTPMIHVPARTREAAVLTPSGMVVGLRLPGAEGKFADLLEEVRIPLQVGDVFVLYTDGVSEAMNDRGDLFGESRLGRIVEEHNHLESTELRERIVREIETFVGDAEQHDDLTMILLKVQASEEHALAAGQAAASRAAFVSGAGAV